MHGQLNRASSDAAQFSLLLAMQESDISERLRFQSEDNNQIFVQGVPANYYRNSPLSADEQSLKNCQIEKNLLHQNQLDASLWRAFHPQPLTVKNDKKHIDEEVITNCSYNVQRKLRSSVLAQNPVENTLPVDETGLYDILQSLN